MRSTENIQPQNIKCVWLDLFCSVRRCSALTMFCSCSSWTRLGGLCCLMCNRLVTESPQPLRRSWSWLRNRSLYIYSSVNPGLLLHSAQHRTDRTAATERSLPFPELNYKRIYTSRIRSSNFLVSLNLLRGHLLAEST